MKGFRAVRLCSAVWRQRIERDPLRRLGGDGRPKPQGGDRLSRRTEQHGDLIRALLVETPDITLAELKEPLAQAPHAQADARNPRTVSFHRRF
jgi:hypothetical protein